MAFSRKRFGRKRKFRRGRRKFGRKKRKFSSNVPRKIYCQPTTYEDINAFDVKGDTSKKTHFLTKGVPSSDVSALMAKNWTFLQTVNKGTHNLNTSARRFRVGAFIQHECCNRSNTTMQVTVYEIMYRKDTPKVILDPSAADFGLGSAKTLWGADGTTAYNLADGTTAVPGGTTSLASYYDYPIWTPYRSPTFCEFVKILKKRSFQCPPGGRFLLKHGMKIKKFGEAYIDALNGTNGAQGIGGWTKQFLISFKGQIATTGTAGGANIGFTTNTLNVVTTRKLTVQTILNSVKTWDMEIGTLYVTNEATAANALKAPVSAVIETVAGFEAPEGEDP